MGEEYVTVETVAGMLEAEIVRGLLEAAGLSVWLSRESAGKAIGLGVGPLGEVDILVPAGDAALAKRLLADYRAGRLANENDSSQGAPFTDTPSTSTPAD